MWWTWTVVGIVLGAIGAAVVWLSIATIAVGDVRRCRWRRRHREVLDPDAADRDDQPRLTRVP